MNTVRCNLFFWINPTSAMSFLERVDSEKFATKISDEAKVREVGCGSYTTIG